MIEVFAMTTKSRVYKLNVSAIVVGIIVVVIFLMGWMYTLGRGTCKQTVARLNSDVETARIEGRKEAYATIDRMARRFSHFYLPSGIRVQCISYSKWPIVD